MPTAPTLTEDKDGTGFACDKYYQVHVGDSGVPLNGGSDLLLEGGLHVGHARVLELRKLNGKRRVPALRRSLGGARCQGCL